MLALLTCTKQSNREQLLLDLSRVPWSKAFNTKLLQQVSEFCRAHPACCSSPKYQLDVESFGKAEYNCPQVNIRLFCKRWNNLRHLKAGRVDKSQAGISHSYKVQTVGVGERLSLVSPWLLK